MVRCSGRKMFLGIQILLITFGSIVAKHLMEDFTNGETFQSIFGSSNGKNSAQRIKRAPRSEFTLVVNTKYERTFSTLKLVTDSLVLSSNTGVWRAGSSLNSHHGIAYYPEHELLHSYNEIHFYQDADEGSAITLFRKYRNSPYVMAGIIAKKYAISNIELSNEDRQTIKKFQVISKSRRSLDDTIETNEKLIENFRRSIDDTIHKKFDNNGKRQAASTIYPKLLVTLNDNDPLGNSDTSVIPYVISYWNVVDLYLRTSRNPEIRLNLAGMILSQRIGTSPYITSANNQLSSTTVLNDISTYFSQEKIRFPQENYNILVTMTTNDLCVDAVGAECKLISAKSKSLNSICSSKDPAVVIAKVQFDWSYKGAEEFSTEIRKTTAAASCLSSKPKQIASDLQGLDGTWMELDGQCLNYDKESESHCVLPGHTDICSELGCKILGKCRRSNLLLRPFRGSKCTTSNKKEGRCSGHLCSAVP